MNMNPFFIVTSGHYTIDEKKTRERLSQIENVELVKANDSPLIALCSGHSLPINPVEQQKRLRLVKYLVEERGANVNHGLTNAEGVDFYPFPLTQAIQSKQQDLAFYLMQRGSKLVFNYPLESTDEDDYTPLSYACRYEMTDIALHIIEQTFQGPNNINDGIIGYSNPLSIACQHGDVRLITSLIHHGALQNVSRVEEWSGQLVYPTDAYLDNHYPLQMLTDVDFYATPKIIAFKQEKYPGFIRQLEQLEEASVLGRKAQALFRFLGHLYQDDAAPDREIQRRIRELRENYAESMEHVGPLSTDLKKLILAHSFGNRKKRSMRTKRTKKTKKNKRRTIRRNKY